MILIESRLTRTRVQTFKDRGLNKNDVSSAVVDIVTRSSRFHVAPAKAVPLIPSLPPSVPPAACVHPSPSQKTQDFPPDWEAKAAPPAYVRARRRPAMRAIAMGSDRM